MAEAAPGDPGEHDRPVQRAAVGEALKYLPGVLISNAGTDMSFGVTVLARTGEDAAGKPRFGSFIVEQGTKGYTLGPKLRGIGWKGLDTRDLYFEGVWVPGRQVAGDPADGLAALAACQGFWTLDAPGRGPVR
jgi:short-chain 2-methylacyl-CoA dehydrogenase